MPVAQVAATELNAQSSRSHSVFNIRVGASFNMLCMLPAGAGFCCCGTHT